MAAARAPLAVALTVALELAFTAATSCRNEEGEVVSLVAAARFVGGSGGGPVARAWRSSSVESDQWRATEQRRGE